MDCPKCGRPSAAGQKFCGECGQQLLELCAACGAGSPLGQKFCGECGQQLAPTTAEPPASPDLPNAATSIPTPAAQPPGERRHATVLFSDLCGYTAMNERLDPEEVQVTMSRIKAEAVRIVESYGGSVNQFVGDEILALFGIPVAHKDDPVRAVRAARELHEMVGLLSPEIEDRLGRPIRLHSGLATGLIVTSRSDDRDGRVGITGDTVNLGARLKQMAADDAILVSPETQRWIGSAFALDPQPAVAPKGKSASLVPYRVGVALSDDKARGRPFVGRQAELRQFQGALDASVASGYGQVIVLRGDPGIGKTRLIDEFRQLAHAEGFAIHAAAALDFGVGRGGDPIRRLIQSLLGVAPHAEEEVRRAAVAMALREGTVDAERESFLVDLLDLPQPESLRSGYDAMDNEHRNRQKRETARNLVQAAASAAPLALIVEDVHWADRLTLAHLAELAMATTDGPLLLLLTTRFAGDPLDLAWRQSAKGVAITAIDLMALHAPEALALARSYLEVTEQVAQRCVERAEGNPLFLEQLLLNAEESADSAIPGSVQSLVLARVDQLADQHRRALQVASVLGQRFDPDAVRQLANDPGYDFTLLATQSLIRPDEDGYLFAHALVRDGVYESLLHTTRREIHLAAATWYRGRDPVLFAEHLALAGDPGAAPAYLEAARAEAAALHFERALGLVQRGNDLDPDPHTACALRLAQGQLQHELGALPESIGSYEQAAGIAQDDRSRCLAWIGMAEGMRLTDDYERCLDVLRLAEPIAHQQKLPELGSQIQFLRGCIYFAIGQGTPCMQAQLEALRLAREGGSPAAEARALGGLADAHYVATGLRASYETVTECLEYSRRHEVARVHAANALLCGYLEWFFEGAEQGLTRLESCVIAAKACGLWRAANFAESIVGLFCVELGRFDRAEPLLIAFRDTMKEAGARRHYEMALYFLADFAERRGNIDQARDLLARALDLNAETGNAHAAAANCGLMATIAPSYSKAREYMNEGVRRLELGVPVHNHYFFWRHSLEAALRHRQWEDMVKFAARLEVFDRNDRTPWAEFFVRRGRVLAAANMGDTTNGLCAEAGDVVALGERMGFMTSLHPLREVLANFGEGAADATL